MEQYNDQVIRKNPSLANGSEEITIDIVASDLVVTSSDPLVASIEEILETESFSSSQSNIYKVPKILRSVNPEAYTPDVISIGPYHYGKEDLKAMEIYKLNYLQSFFSRINLKPVNVIEKVRTWEERARNCYAEPINMSSDEFVKLILVDGCFVVEYSIRKHFPQFQDESDHLLHGRLSQDLLHDFIKLENQLPFFVLEGLFQLYPFQIDHPIKNISFSELIHFNFPPRYKNYQKQIPNGVFGHNIGNHLLNHLWLYFIPHALSSSKQSKDGSAPKYLYLCPSASELDEAGVIFKMAENKCIGDVITGITFKNGVLEIPHIQIYDNFETYLRNLIAFEQCHLVDYYVTHFALFMDDLINTEKDVSLLIKGRIISNHLGSNEDVLRLFNNLCKQVAICGEFYYYNVCRDIREYYGTRRHRWMASLRRNYFNTPWASISFVAATVLLILTFIQTIFSARK